MKPARQRSRVLQILVFAMVLLAVGAAVARSMIAPADEKTLQEHLGDLRSIVSESLLLIQEERSGHLRKPYRRTELEELGKEAAKIGTSLEKARTKPELAPRFQDAASLARNAAALLAPLSSPSDTSGAFNPEMAAVGELPSIRQRVMALEAELEK